MAVVQTQTNRLRGKLKAVSERNDNDIQILEKN